MPYIRIGVSRSSFAFCYPTVSCCSLCVVLNDMLFISDCTITISWNGLIKNHSIFWQISWMYNYLNFSMLYHVHWTWERDWMTKFAIPSSFVSTTHRITAWFFNLFFPISNNHLCPMLQGVLPFCMSAVNTSLCRHDLVWPSVHNS